jgi:integrase
MADSVDSVVALFIERHCKQSNRPRTAQETERLLRSHVLPRWRGRTVRDITRRDVLDVLDRVIDGGAPIAANRVLSATRKFFNWCVERDIIASSPCAGVKPPTAERSRDRVLSDSELALVWRAAYEVGGPFGSLVQLLILTGQRRDEVARMEWDELNLKLRLWTMRPERVKNAQEHEVALSEPVITILQFWTG